MKDNSGKAKMTLKLIISNKTARKVLLKLLIANIVQNKLWPFFQNEMFSFCEIVF